MVSPNNIAASQWPSFADEEMLYNLDSNNVQIKFHSTEKLMNSMNLELQQPLSSDSSSSDSASTLLGNGNVPQNQGTVFTQSSSQHQMDLDEYLAHEGQGQVISMSSDPSPMIPLKQNVSCSRYHVGLDHENQELNVTVPNTDSDFHVPEVKFKNGSLEYAFGESQMDIPVPGKPGPGTQFDSKLDVEKKRHASLDEKKRKSIEKRERRMIKNRESAARSRARKQAYTKQLEHDVQQLKRMNELLKRRTELQRIWSSSSRLEACCNPLRRTNSF